MISCNVAFTGIDATENPYPGLSVLRAIKDSGEFQGITVVLTYDSLCTGLYQHDLVDKVYLVPYPSEPEEFLFSRLCEIHKKTKLDVIIPCLDSEIVTYSRLAQRLKDLGIHVLVPHESAVKARSKLFMTDFCRTYQLPYPKSHLIHDANEIENYAAELHYPLLLKGSIIDTAIADNAAEAHVFFNRLANQWGLPLIIQEKLDGEEYDVAVVADQNSHIAGKVAIRKMGITQNGKAFSGVTVDGKEFNGLVDQVVKALKWQGPLEIEIMKNPNLNKMHILEINARLPTWIYATTGVGHNLPLLNLKLALGQKLDSLAPYKKGVMFIRIIGDSFCNINDLAQLNLKGQIDWVTSRNKNKDLAVSCYP